MVITLSRMPALEAPATPGADEARRAAREELARPIYREPPNLLERLWEWILKHADASTAIPGVSPWVSVVIVTLSATLIIAALVLLLRRLTVPRRAARPGDELFSDDRDAAALALAADQAAQRQDYATAVIERFRAIIRSLDEHGIIEEYPGMTALESVGLAAEGLPAGEVILDLRQAAALFDSVRYGDVLAGHEQDEWMRDLAQRVTRAARSASRHHLSARAGA
ncbi:DUF4129 domain-containing protein [Actinomyces slackii]|uniref:Uncharacterized protein n=1 Tax=Actinomyces slackii TaxID=52774 RepID=A0A3S4WIM9_9ACTO|nr:DUF4129 domain-containing protein [Actinomyces slackii]VEG75838.1 Uncharacterised protein [Actinomyces slackii]